MKIPSGLARQAFRLEKNAPKLLFGAGVTGMVGSTVLACRATLQLEDRLAKAREELELVRNRQEFIEKMKNDSDPKVAEKYVDEEYTDHDQQRDTTLVYIRSVVSVGKLYAPPILLGAASIIMLSKSHSILQQRNAALTAAYLGLEQAFNEYRGRVREKYGEDAEDEIRFPREKIKEINPETGREHSVEIVDPTKLSIYARIFDEKSKEWTKDPEWNLIYLKNQQQFANDMLRARGHVLLNDVYDCLDIPRSSAGTVVGWVLGDEGDNYIDFGIYSKANSDFVNGRERSVVLDFNVDGLIYDQIEDIPEEKLSWQRD